MSSDRDGFWQTPAGEMPRSWRATRLRELAREVTERVGDRDGMPVLSVTKHRGIVRADTYFNKAVHSRETANYKLVRRGQFAYATIHLDEGSIGRLTVEEAGVVSPMYTVFEITRDLDPDFLLALLKSPRYLGRYAALGQGTVNRRASISFDALGSLVIHHPPLAEQQAIAAGLRAVNTTVTGTLKLLEHLHIVEQGVMAEVLARGCSSHHTLYKDTPFGRIPESWELRQVGTLAKFTSGNGFRPGDWGKKGLPIIRIQNLNGSREFNYFAGKPDPQWLIEPGSLLFAWAGSRGVSFGPRIWDGPTGVLNQHIFQVHPEAGVDKEYLYWVLWWITERIEKKAHGFKTTLVHVHKSDITDATVPFPPREEQRAIAAIGQLLDRRIVAEQAYLDQLQESKRGLAQALLFGRKRVSSQAHRRKKD
jgi:type I restriction enzyme, S subunit